MSYRIYPSDCILSKATPDKTISYPETVTTGAKALNMLIKGEVQHQVWNKLYLSSLWKSVRFPEGYVYEDIRTTYKTIAQCNRICTISDILYLNRKREGSISRTYSVKNISDWILAHDILEDYVNTHTPEIFSEETKSHFLNKSLRAMEVTCTEYMSQNKDEYDQWQSIRQKILEKNIHFREIKGLKNIFVHFTFIHCPWLLRRLRHIWLFLKRLAGRDV